MKNIEKYGKLLKIKPYKAVKAKVKHQKTTLKFNQEGDPASNNRNFLFPTKLI